MTATTGQTYGVVQADATLKQVYADKIIDMCPSSHLLAEDIDFVSADKENGNYYNQPVHLSYELGLTFNSDGSPFALNKGQSPTELNAQIRGSEIVNRVTMSYGLLNRAMKGDTSTRAGMKSFINATKYKMQALIGGMSFAREAMLLYGGGSGANSALATVSATTGSASTTLVVTVAVADWAAALWVACASATAGLECDIYSSGGTKRNTAGTGATTIYKLTAVDAVNYKLTFTSEAATNVATVVATDQIFFAGSRVTGMLGFIGACQTTSSFWGIDPVANPLWKPQQTVVGGALTFEAIMQGCTKVADIGFDGKLNVYVSPAGWQDLADDQAAMINYAQKSNGKISMGFEELQFRSQTGIIAIKAHKLMKRGLALGLPDGECMRIGSTDITTTMPGVGKMLRELEDTAGVEARCYTDQAPFCQKPAFMHLWSGIVNSVA